MSDEQRERTRARRRSPGAVKHGRLKTRGPLALILSGIGLVVAVALVAGSSVAAVAAWDVLTSVNKGVKLSNEQSVAATIGEMEGGFNVLIVGSDSRAGQDAVFDSTAEGELNDVNILVHVAADHNSATVLSIPRDMVIPFADCEGGGGGWTGPINAVMNEGGLPCVVKTVEELTGLSIPFAVLTQFSGVINLSDAVGGVEVCVSTPIEDEYTQTFLDAGVHNLQGMAALQFLRTRHGVGDGSDLTRIGNQQIFMSALARKLQSAGTLSNPVTLYKIAKAAASSLTLSNSLNNVDTLVSLAMALKDIPLENIAFVQFPGSTGQTVAPYTGRVKPDMEAANAIFAAMLNDQPVQLTGTTAGSVVSDQPAPVQTPTPTATSKKKSSASKKTATPTATPTPTETIVPVEAAVLPSDIKGQTANQYTCSAGRTLDDQ